MGKSQFRLFLPNVDRLINPNSSQIPISFLFVLEATVGQTYRVSIFRIIGTIGGSIMAVIIHLIARNNPYALVLLSLVHGSVTASFMLFSSTPGIGVVA